LGGRGSGDWGREGGIRFGPPQDVWAPQRNRKTRKLTLTGFCLSWPVTDYSIMFDVVIFILLIFYKYTAKNVNVMWDSRFQPEIQDITDFLARNIYGISRLPGSSAPDPGKTLLKQ
jgi:hypothetical protein